MKTFRDRECAHPCSCSMTKALTSFFDPQPCKTNKKLGCKKKHCNYKPRDTSYSPCFLLGFYFFSSVFSRALKSYFMHNLIFWFFYLKFYQMVLVLLKPLCEHLFWSLCNRSNIIFPVFLPCWTFKSYFQFSKLQRTQWWTSGMNISVPISDCFLSIQFPK